MTANIGKITKWNDEKGFGFITPNSGGKSVFIHINDFSNRHPRPVEGLSVTYRLSTDAKGRRCANKASPVGGQPVLSKADKQKTSSIRICVVFFLVLLGLAVFDRLPWVLVGFYIVISALTYTVYAIDKSAAKSGDWRTSERSLHFFSLIGGWPGAAIAQSRLRHKSKKLSFRIVYFLTMIINCGILGWLLTPVGAHKLEVLLQQLKNMNF
jgi:uncharacterized membrane protein YsdA (DUF1294 family)/cold shock CspA family protein